MKKLLSLIVAIGLMFVLSITAFADDKCSYTPVEELPIDEASGRKIITDYRQFSDIYTKGISGKYILDNSDPYGKGKFNNQFTAEGHYEDSLVFYRGQYQGGERYYQHQYGKSQRVKQHSTFHSEFGHLCSKYQLQDLCNEKKYQCDHVSFRAQRNEKQMK